MSKLAEEAVAMGQDGFTWKGVGPLLAAISLFASCENALAAAVVVPDGDMQLSNSRAVPTSIQTHDLTAPISSTADFISVGANPQGQPSVGASIHAPAYSPVNSWFGNGSASLGYWIYVSGSDLTTVVPILFSANLSASAGGDHPYEGVEAAYGHAGLSLQDYNANPLTTPNSFVAQLYQQSLEAQFNTATQGGVLNLSDSMAVLTGHFIGVAITADVSAQDGGFATALADPYFQIDPAFLLDHPDYSLTFSPFVGNDAPATAGVPEPATWALLLVGFGAIGASMRRKQRQTVRYSFA